jgi:Fic family protein
MPWKPVYTITPRIAQALMEIEAARAVIDVTRLPQAVAAQLRQKARIRSSHYSTAIEGNRLTLAEAGVILEEKKAKIRGRERDVEEVRYCWEALVKVDDMASGGADFNEHLIKKLHGILIRGKRAQPTPWRDEQNVIRDSLSGRIIYLPPEARDVPELMKDMVQWVQEALSEKVPVPLIAALVHYQFVTIHPYYDGNGRTARLLATFILQRHGYGLQGLLSMEEHHARDLNRYYVELAVQAHHNYYEGRAGVALTPWLDYFTSLLSRVFREARDEALINAEKKALPEPDELLCLDRRARTVLSLFSRKVEITTQDMAGALGLSPRMVRDLAKKWVKGGWLVMARPANRTRAYSLSAAYRQFVGRVSAESGQLV